MTVGLTESPIHHPLHYCSIGQRTLSIAFLGTAFLEMAQLDLLYTWGIESGEYMFMFYLSKLIGEANYEGSETDGNEVSGWIELESGVASATTVLCDSSSTSILNPVVLRTCSINANTST